VLNKYIGNKEFYQKVAMICVPLILQQVLNSGMGIVDTIMVSSIGEVTSVGTASQIENICITICFGAVTGIGIFTAQFFGAKDYVNMKKTFGIASLFALGSGFLWMIIVWLFPKEVIRFFINDEVVIASAIKYLAIAKFTYIPVCISFCFSYMYRCMHKTKTPMVIGIIAMSTNCFFNYCLIFGKFGMPELGVAGAAYGTLIAQIVSVTLYISYTWSKKQPFVGTFKEMYGFGYDFARPILRRTFPLIVNEALFGLGVSLHAKAFGLLGKLAMDSYYVSRQIMNLFFVICNGIGSAAGAILGAELGKDNIKTATEYSNYFLGLAAMLSVATTILVVVSAKPLVIPFGIVDSQVFNTAVLLVQLSAIRIALRLFNVVVFSALRAGGDAKYLTFLDSGIMLGFGIPLVYFLVLVCGLKDIAVVFLLVQLEQLLRVILGLRRFKGNIWAKNLTSEING
jgi:putative efflux protein, MATE family